MPEAVPFTPRVGAEGQQKVVNIELVVNVGDKRQLRFLADAPDHATDEEFGRRVDRLMRASDRVKAYYDLKEREAVLAQNEKLYQGAVDDEQRCESAWLKAKAAREAEYLLADGVYRREHAVWADSRRNPDVKEPGPLQAKKNRAAQIKVEMETDAVKHEAEKANFHTTVERWEKELAKDRAEIERLRAEAQ